MKKLMALVLAVVCVLGLEEPIQGLCKTDIGSFWLSLPSPLPLGDG